MVTTAVTNRTHALAAATVAAGTSAYVVAAVVGEIADGFGVSVGVAGQVITAFALAYAVGSPVLAVVTARVERRVLLVAALVVMALGNVGAAVVGDFGLLLVARVVTACGAALATPAATAVAAELNGPGARGRAIAVVTGGLTAATLVGVPAGRVVAEWGGYRAAFLLTALLCVAAAVVVRLAVPAVAADVLVVGVRRRVGVVADARVRRLLVVSSMACLGTFAAYGFLGPLLTAAPASWLLFAYGFGGVVGNVVGGAATDRFGARGPLLVALGGTAAVLVVLPSALVSPIGAAVVMVVWGGLFWAFNPPLFALLVQVRPAEAGVVLALNASAIYLGIAGAGVLGGVVASVASPAAVPVVGAVLALGAFLVALGVAER
ncbi:MFS transporter [Actinosynnema sp. CA-248983]